MSAVPKLLAMPRQRRTRGKVRTLAVLARDGRDVTVKLHAVEAVLEFRPKGSRSPFFCPLERIWKAHESQICTEVAVSEVVAATARLVDSRQLVFGVDVLPPLYVESQEQAGQAESGGNRGLSFDALGGDR